MHLRLPIIAILILVLVGTVSLAQDEMDAESACGSLQMHPTLAILNTQFVAGEAESYCMVSGMAGNARYQVKLPVADEYGTGAF